MEVSLSYWNELAKQTLLVSSLLCGFSITVVANMLVSERNDKLARRLLQAAALSAGSFLVAVFAMFNIVMATTPGGYLARVSMTDFNLPRIVGLSTFMLGLLSLCLLIGLSGFTKSRRVGTFTAVAGSVSLLLILTTMIRFSS